jgi:acetyl esterase
MWQVIKAIWQAIKVWGFRKYYRFISARGWKGKMDPPRWNALEIPGPAGPIHARMFSDHSREDRPLIVYYHGGGHVIGDLDTHTPFCHMLHRRSGCNVIAVDYRLAPEHPFPAAPDDCLAAARWIAGHIGDFGSSDHRIVLAGDSAGANLASVACLEAEPELREKIAGEVIIYPIVDHYNAGFPSHVERATGQTLTAKIVVFFLDTYLGGSEPEGAAAQRAFPLRSDRLASLPPTFMVTAEFDPLRDEGKAYSDKLRDAGVSLQYRHFETAAHGFACSEGPNDNFEAMMDDLIAWLDQLD